MRVLHLLDTLAMGGKEVFTVGLASHQRSTGTDARIATFDPGNAFDGELRDASIPHVGMSRGKGPLDLRLVRKIRAQILGQGIDLLHCHSENPALYGALALFRRPGVPMVVTVHSGDRDRIPLRHKLEHWVAYRRADRIVCVAPSLLERITTREFAPVRKAITLFNGVLKPAHGGPEDARALRREWGAEAGTTVVACIGRLHPVKNHLRFLEAFALARSRIGGSILIMTGEGPLQAETVDKVRSLGLGEHVRMLGLRKDVGRILAAADIFALPSLNEGHSISLLEACSHGKAILASRRGGNPDIVSHGESGLLADPESPKDMAECLVRLAADPDLRLALGQGAEKAFLGRFSMEACAAGYAQVYREVLEKRQRPA